MPVPIRSLAARALLLAVLAAALGACTSHHSRAKATSSPSGPALTGTLRIAADSELRPGVDALVTGFAHAHRTLSVTVTYAGTQALTTGLQRGFAADVVAVGGPIDPLVTAGLVVTGSAKPVARDPLAIVVGAGNPQGLTTPGALAGRGVRVAIVDPSLPWGAAAQQALGVAGVRLPKVTTELTPGAVVGDVVSGTVDAGLVGASDVVTGGSAVTAVALPAADGVTMTYEVAPVGSPPDAAAATAFIAYALSPAGQQVLQAAGFSPG